ncbi:MAG: hypothetical protein JWN48_1938 [Myxococcaceae bacterium]|nr:hypothetical protein [Myxococcaceae bacterium]
MGSDFSAVDAELDTLESSPAVDALSLARSYAGASVFGSSAEPPASSGLQVVDAALNELDADGILLRTRSSFPPERPKSRPPEARAEAPVAGAGELSSEEIVLPDPVPREPQFKDAGSGEMPLHATAPRSGSFSMEQSERALKHSGRDDTLEPFDEELVDARLDDEERVEFTAAVPAQADGAAPRPSLFDRRSQHPAAVQEEADAAFAELFSEAATHQSSIPSSRNSQVPETYGDDTETFDSSSLAFIENDVKNADISMDEELDSAEFEIVVDSDAGNGTAPASRSPSDAPEKRPSFLGRLFGRKED